jgi:hypothetical protein
MKARWLVGVAFVLCAGSSLAACAQGSTFQGAGGGGGDDGSGQGQVIGTVKYGACN